MRSHWIYELIVDAFLIWTGLLTLAYLLYTAALNLERKRKIRKRAIQRRKNRQADKLYQLVKNNSQKRL